MSCHRLFFGLEIPDLVKRQLLAFKQPLNSARWQSARQMHITLFFLGSIADHHLEAIPRLVGTLNLEPFDLKPRGLGYFGPIQYPKILWVGVEPVAPLAQLHETLAERLQPLGIEPEGKPFKPHITLARFKGRTARLYGLLEDYADFEASEFRVDQVTLFESHLSPGGSHYEALHRFPLTGI